MRIVATNRFRRDFADFALKYRDFENNLRDFIKFRRTARPDQPFGPKDSPLKDNLRGFRRVHLMYGKGLVIYQIASGQVRLAAVVEHNSVEGGKDGKLLASYLHSLTPDDYRDFSLPKASADQPEKVGGEPSKGEPLTHDQQEELKQLFMMLALHPEDRDVLDKARRHDFGDFLVWARTALGFEDNSRDRAIFHALGDPGMLAKRARLYLERTAHLVKKAEPEPQPVAAAPEPAPQPEPVAAAPEPQPVKRGPGRPRKVVSDEPTIQTRRPRGRPRKVPAEVPAPPSASFAHAISDLTGDEMLGYIKSAKQAAGKPGSAKAAPTRSKAEDDLSRYSKASQREIDAMFRRWEKNGWKDYPDR